MELNQHLEQEEPFSPLVALPNTYRAFFGAFSHLNTIQKKTISPILNGKDVLLQSSTGSGKTEAIIAPAMERLIQNKNRHSIIYIVPTKALAIDLKRRLETAVTEKLGLSMGIRTGDLKLSGGENPDLIITTPESFDVMLGSKNITLHRFIRRIGTVIIDEVHVFLYKYRGEQLKSVLKRLRLKCQHRVQQIALSATMGDLNQIGQFFNFSANTTIIKSASQRDIIPHLVTLKQIAEIISLLIDLHEHWQYQKILIFVNSRGRCDELLGLLDTTPNFKNQVKIHYSNLKTTERHAVEKWFKTEKSAICIATSTLELGIDIGDVDGVILFEPPDTVMGFLQRIGRANRKLNHVHFWGICQGGNASHQLLRFLAFLSLSAKNKMEQLYPRQLYSVLFQQILSCCYEKDQLSLKALLSLLTEENNSPEAERSKQLMTDIFNHMCQNYWLKQTKIKGLYSGGKRYFDYRLENKIWSNFPPSDEEYVLELEQQSIADIPSSLVKQLEVGDQVQLAGKHVRVINIEENPYKRVIVVPNLQQQDNKTIFWIGKGCFLSYDVAQEIKLLLQSPKRKGLLQGVFRRPLKLFHQLLTNYQQSVTLENQIVVSRTHEGYYRYWTFLGGIGNIILQRSIEAQLETDELVFNTTADDTAIECSEIVDFKQLELPKTETEFQAWCDSYQSILLSMFSLNNFAQFIPGKLMLQELNSFLFDPRLLEQFNNYQRFSSTIVKGDADFFNLSK